MSEQQKSKVNDQYAVVVATDYEWLPITPATPRGAKVQLLTRWGVSVYGQLSAGNLKDFVAWAPCPNKPDWLKRLLD